MKVRGLVSLATIFLACTVISLNINCGGSSGGGGSSDEGTTCTDADNDGYFAQAGCGTTVDCDDNDPNNWTSCDTCVDNDGDTYYTGCDDYVSINGPDCDDSIYNVWSDCSDCADNDSDGWGAGTSCGTTVDCDDGNSTVYPGAPELCDGIDHQCPGDAGYGLIFDSCTVGPMALIPSGCFDMGDHFNEAFSYELPVHNVCITSDFYMDVHEVTNAEYEACVDAGACTAPGDTSSYTRTNYYGNLTYDNYPVIFVSWNQANDYCTWAGKRLPTEAEWEYAARGGLSGKRYPWGDSITCDDACYGRYTSGYGCYNYGGLDNDTHPVGSYPANGYGLYDMAGNVWEWTNDWYQSDYYSSSPTNDPQGPDTGSSFVMRGSCWGNYPRYLRVAHRFRRPPTHQYDSLGFRCAGD